MVIGRVSVMRMRIRKEWKRIPSGRVLLVSLLRMLVFMILESALLISGTNLSRETRLGSKLLLQRVS